MRRVLPLPTSPGAVRKLAPSASSSPKPKRAQAAKDHHGHHFSKLSTKSGHKTLTLLASDNELDEDAATTTTCDSLSSEDEFEQSFMDCWVVDENEVEMHKAWFNKQKLIPGSRLVTSTTCKPPRSPLASTLTVSTSTTPTLLDLAAAKPPPPPPLSPSSTSTSSLVPALDLDRVASPRPSLGSTSSRRNTIASPHETRSSEAPVQTAELCWKVGRISPGRDAVDQPLDAGNCCLPSPPRLDVQLSFGRLEAQSDAAAATAAQEAPEPKRTKTTKKKKKNVRSLNSRETKARKVETHNEKAYRRRSQGSPPLQLRALSDDCDGSAAAAGYLAEDDDAAAADNTVATTNIGSRGSRGSGGSDSRAAGSVASAPVSPQASSQVSLPMSRVAEFPLSRSHSSEQCRTRRTITKQVTKREAPEGEAANPVGRRSQPVSPRKDDEEQVVAFGDDHGNHGDNEQAGPELTWKTIWEPETATATATAAVVAAEPKTVTTVVLKRGLAGRSSSLPPPPLLAPPLPAARTSPSPSSSASTSPSSHPSPESALPPHIEPLEFPAFATSPPSCSASPAMSARAHRRRAESSGAPPSLVIHAPPPLASLGSGARLQSPHHHQIPHRARAGSPSPGKRQAGLGFSSVARGLHRRKHMDSSESGDFGSLLRTQSEEIPIAVLDGADNDDNDDDNDLRRVSSSRQMPRAGTGEWRIQNAGDLMAARRAYRLERVRSFGQELGAMSCGSEDDEPFMNDDAELFLDSDVDDDADDDSDGDEETEQLEAELTSFLKRTRSGNHRSSNFLDVERLHNVTVVRHGRHPQQVPRALSDAGVDDSGLESGESTNGLSLTFEEA